MSENLHNIDDLFKRAIEEHNDTPSPQVWDSIDKNLDRKKVVSISRKYNKLKWAAAILLLFSTGMAMYVWQTKIKNKELVKENRINRSSKTNSNKIDKGSATEDKKQNEKNGKTEDDNSLSSANKITTNSPPNKDGRLNSTPILYGTGDKEKTGEIEITRREKKLIEPALDNKKDPKINDNLATENAKSYEALPQKYFVQLPGLINTNSYINRQVQSLSPFSYRPGMINSDNAAALRNAEVADNKTGTGKTKTRKLPGNSRFSATIFFAPEFGSSSVKNDRPRYREDARHEIKSSEKIRTSVNYGALVGYNIGNNWKVESGAYLFTRVTDINAKTIYARPDRRGNVNYRISCSAGSAYVPTKSGSTPAQGDSTKILSAKNTLQYVSVPISVKYSIGKGKLKVIPGMGLSLNILSKGKLETVMAGTGGNESSSTNDIEGLKSKYFNSQFGLAAEYQVSKNVSVHFSPTAKVGLSSINKDAAVKTKLNSFGLSAGITIRL